VYFGDVVTPGALSNLYNTDLIAFIKRNELARELSQLKIMQEVITLLVFVPFAFFYMDQPLKLDYLWAGLCLVGAVYFIYRS
jgi:uncharacterized protein (DUF486 family)